MGGTDFGERNSDREPGIQVGGSKSSSISLSMSVCTIGKGWKIGRLEDDEGEKVRDIASGEPTLLTPVVRKGEVIEGK